MFQISRNPTNGGVIRTGYQMGPTGPKGERGTSIRGPRGDTGVGIIGASNDSFDPRIMTLQFSNSTSAQIVLPTCTGATGADGQAGRGIISVYEDSGYLYTRLDDGTINRVGPIPCITGPAGDSIGEMWSEDNGEVQVVSTSGKRFKYKPLAHTGATGPVGMTGATGAEGAGIAEIQAGTNGMLCISLSNGKSFVHPLPVDQISEVDVDPRGHLEIITSKGKLVRSKSAVPAGATGATGATGAQGRMGPTVKNVLLDAQNRLVFVLENGMHVATTPLPLLKGEDGVSVAGAHIQNNGLYLSMSNGTQVCVDGNVQGPTGPRGTWIESAHFDSDAKLVLGLSDGSTVKTEALQGVVGATGPQGARGEQGQRGLCVNGVRIEGEASAVPKLVFDLDNGTCVETPCAMIRGHTGPQGASVCDLKLSAEGKINVHLDDGRVLHTGTAVPVCTGPTGARGERGATGPRGFGIRDMQINPDGTLKLVLEDTTVVRTRSQIPRGATGARGPGFKSINLDVDGTLMVHTEDGSVLRSKAKVPRGPTGARGERGPGFRRTWVTEGVLHMETEDGKVVKVDGLRGPTGSQGPTIKAGEIDRETKSLVLVLDNGERIQTPVAGVTGPRGVAGAGVSSANIDTSGRLILSLDNGKRIQATGVLPRGARGPTGAGVSGASVEPSGELCLELEDGRKVVAKGGSIRGAQIVGASVNSSGNLELDLSDKSRVATTVKLPRGAEGPQGKPGVSVTNALIDDSGRLALTRSDGEIVFASGWCRGPTGCQGVEGPQGKEGPGVSAGVVDANGCLTLTRSDGQKVQVNGSCRGATGPKGDRGEAGAGIARANVDESGRLTLTRSDGQVLNAVGSCRGPTGARGPRIKNARVDSKTQKVHFFLEDGKQVLTELVLPKGNTGATGPKGPVGATGSVGASIETVQIDKNGTVMCKLTNGQAVRASGSVLRGATGATGAQGATGAMGVRGSTGATGVGEQISEVVIDSEGYMTVKVQTGSTTSVRAVRAKGRVRGPTGATGMTGARGATGARGKDAPVLSGAHLNGGKLCLLLDDGTQVQTNVEIPRGPTGERGVSVCGASMDAQGRLTLELDNGETVPVRGPPLVGPTGASGVGIESIAVDAKTQQLVTVLENGKRVQSGIVIPRGPTGARGVRGDRGADGRGYTGPEGPPGPGVQDVEMVDNVLRFLMSDGKVREFKLVK